MNVVITMGGLGSRFRKAGYTVPKYEIEVCGKTLFEWSMLSLSDFREEKFIFIVRKEDSAEAFIKNKCKLIGINNIHILELDALTKGQAESAMFAQKVWNEGDPLFIYNIDTYVESGHMNRKIIQGDGFIPCFCAKGDHWSFVKLNSEGEVIEVREKERISDYCTIGAYYFSSCKLFMQTYNDLYNTSSHLEAGEQYIAPMYNLLINQKKKVRIQVIEALFVHVLGTPEEVNIFREIDLKSEI